ncbi:MAG: DNA-directed DNA polymerase II small subunit [Candidatus Bathyarchaeia archaeon]
MEDGVRRALMLTIESGYQLEQEAFALLQEYVEADPEDIVKRVIDRIKEMPEKPLFITRTMLEEAVKGVPIKKSAEPITPTTIGVGKAAFRPYARGVTSDIEVLEDPTEEISSTGKVEDFFRYFRDRFSRIERILRQRLDVRDAVPLRDALEATRNSEVKTVGIVTEKRERRRAIFIQLEDRESSATVFVPNAAKSLYDKAQRLLLDQLICVQVRKGRNDLLIATEIIYPDIPERKARRAYEPVYAALISDLHVGSSMFLDGQLSRFVSWLRGEVGNRNQLRVAGRVKYVVVAGDLVDGIGVYPGQEDELAITDIYDQYRTVAQFIEQIPDYIEVIIIPGNHDATRQALPQPAILKKYAEPIYEGREVVMLGDPARVRLHGVELLLYHGRSLDDVIGAVPEVMYRNLATTVSKAMEHLLKTRHLAPVYGQKTPIAPEPRDFLVIDEPPDIFHAGHVHVMGYEVYRGTLILNSGSWQSQTSYQRKMGLSPTAGVAPIVDLETFQVMPMDFTTLSS